MKNNCYVILIALALKYAHGYVPYWNTPNHLHQVHGLYVKPSVDGTTGDLFVAASEDNGKNAQWLSDQSINFLPVAAASHASQTAVPYTYTSSLTATNLPHDETLVTTRKRAVFTSPTVKYTYAHPSVPMPNEGAPVPYTYAAPAMPVSKPIEGKTSQCAERTTDIVPTATYPQYSPYNYYYSHLMSMMLSNVMNNLKNSGVSEDVLNSAMGQTAQLWSPYSYPLQYVMVDPASWSQSQPAAAKPAETSVIASEDEENENENA